MRDVIIVPTYNERKNIVKLLRVIHSVLPSVNILVVDDNSPDGTAQEVERMKKEIPNLDLLLRPGKEGLGKAYIDAFKRVIADPNVRNICTMDADFSHGPQFLSQMFQKIEKFDVVIGSRYIKGGGIKGWPFWRKMLSRIANLYCRVIFRLPIKDCTSGFICMQTTFFKKIDLEKINASGFAFLMELKYFLGQKGARFAEVPIIVENRKEGKSKITSGIILEGLITSFNLVFDCYKNKIGKILASTKEAFKKRGVFFIIYYGPKVFYYTFLSKKDKLFYFQNKSYSYFYRLYNCTCLNERAVEIPIVLWALKANENKRILEVGNVLSHYFNISHNILDKYEKAEGVINQDVVDFRPQQKYDLIVSISTLEHVGWDEQIKDPKKVLSAVNNLKNCLVEGGKMIVTLGLGYNPGIDGLVLEEKLGFEKQYFFKKISGNNEWEETNKEGIRGINYDRFRYSAKGLAIGVIGEAFKS